MAELTLVNTKGMFEVTEKFGLDAPPRTMAYCMFFSVALEMVKLLAESMAKTGDDTILAKDDTGERYVVLAEGGLWVYQVKQV